MSILSQVPDHIVVNVLGQHDGTLNQSEWPKKCKQSLHQGEGKVEFKVKVGLVIFNCLASLLLRPTSQRDIATHVTANPTSLHKDDGQKCPKTPIRLEIG